MVVRVACAVLLCAFFGTCCADVQLWNSQGLYYKPDEAEAHRKPGDGARLLEELSKEPYFSKEDRQPIRSRRERDRTGEIKLHRERMHQEVRPPFNVSRMPVVTKCCPMGQNLSITEPEGPRGRPCGPSDLAFQPVFHNHNETDMWDYEDNLWEAIVENPCPYQKYQLDPSNNSADEFFLLLNGSLVVPGHNPRLLGPKDFCMESFWSPRGAVALPLVCFDSPASAIWQVVVSCLMLVSVPFLLMTCLVHTLVQQRSSQGLSLAVASHSACLAMAFFLLAAVQLMPWDLPKLLCVIIAHLIQFFFLSCFCWLNVICIDTYLSAKSHMLDSSTPPSPVCHTFQLSYNLYAWGLAIVVTLVTVLIDQAPLVPLAISKPNIGVRGCWFSSETTTLIYFYGPVLVILIINVVLYILTFVEVWKYRPEAVSDNRWRELQLMSKKCLQLLLVMGISWLLEIVSWAVGGTSPIFMLGDVLNALQGVFVCFIFVTKDHRRLLKHIIANKLPCLRRDMQHTMVSNERIHINYTENGNSMAAV